MDNLYTFGCSNTRGDALDDIWDSTTKVSMHQGDGYYPSKYAWPQLLADKLNLNCINCGTSGASNKEIWHKLVTTDINKNDTVVVQWTFIDRYYVIDGKQYNTDNQILPWKGHRPTTMDQRDKRQLARNDAFYEFLHTDTDVLYDVNLRIAHADLYAKQQGFKIFHITCIVEGNTLGIQLLPFNHAKILKTSIQHIQNETQSCANDRNKTGGHPGILAHKIHADNIYNEIFKK